MPVDSKHRQYQANWAKWRRVRDVVAGEDAVKARGEAYLPRLEGQSFGADGYHAYRDRAEFHEATGRTLDGLAGAIFRKDPMITVPAGFADRLERVTPGGLDFVSFAKMVVREVIAVGRYGVLVDTPGAGGEPFLAGYTAESMINWRTTLLAGGPVLSLVVLREDASRPAAGDPFETETGERFRVLQLAPLEEGGAPVYLQTLYERRRTGAGREDIVAVDGPFTPTRRGEPLDFMPFRFIGPTALDAEVQKSPIQGLVNVNLSHFRTSADLEHGAHFTALPTAWVAGDLKQGADDDELRIGSGAAWHLEADARAGFLEYTGQGLDALEKRLERKEAHMAVLGARLLEDQKAGVEAAATISLRHRGENSMLASLADTVGRGLTEALAWLVHWAGGPEGAVRVELNKDFFENPLGPKEMLELVNAWQRGGIGGEALFHNLKAGERLPEAMTFDDWQRDIRENRPNGPMGGSGGGSDDGSGGGSGSEQDGTIDSR